MGGLRDALKGLAVPLRAMAIAVLGAVLAWSWFSGWGFAALLGAVAFGAAGLGLDAAGRRADPGRPTRTVALMEWWILVPMTLAALASAAVIIATVELAVPEGTDPATKETIGALAAAITAFLSSGFVDWAADEKDSRLSDRIRDHFYDRYKENLRVGSRAELLVYAEHVAGVEGWGRRARKVRAAKLQERWPTDSV